MTSLAGRVAIITGGASGIGRATAVLLARQGAAVFVGDVRQSVENKALFAELGVHEQHCDVRHEADVQALVERAVARRFPEYAV